MVTRPTCNYPLSVTKHYRHAHLAALMCLMLRCARCGAWPAGLAAAAGCLAAAGLLLLRLPPTAGAASKGQAGRSSAQTCARLLNATCCANRLSAAECKQASCCHRPRQQYEWSCWNTYKGCHQLAAHTQLQCPASQHVACILFMAAHVERTSCKLLLPTTKHHHPPAAHMCSMQSVLDAHTQLKGAAYVTTHHQTCIPHLQHIRHRRIQLCSAAVATLPIVPAGLRRSPEP